jgi:hypothetical protein
MPVQRRRDRGGSQSQRSRVDDIGSDAVTAAGSAEACSSAASNAGGAGRTARTPTTTPAAITIPPSMASWPGHDRTAGSGYQHLRWCRRVGQAAHPPSAIANTAATTASIT